MSEDLNKPVETRPHYEVFISEINEKIKEVVDRHPEVRSFMYSIDWKLGNSELPFCALFSKEYEERVLLECVKQSVKLTNHVFDNLTRKLQDLKTALDQADKIIKTAQSIQQVDSKPEE